MKIYLVLLLALVIPQISIAATAKFTNEYDEELNRNKPTAEAVVFDSLIKASKSIQAFWYRLLDRVNPTQFRLTLCKLNDFAISKIKVGLPRNPDCPPIAP